MILAYCITPQPQRGGPTAKHFHVRTDGAIFSKVVAKKYNPAPLSIEMPFAVSLDEMAEASPGFTANRAINAVPVVCAAAPGIRTSVDLPQVIAHLGRGNR